MDIYNKMGRLKYRAGSEAHYRELVKFAQPTIRDVRPVDPVVTNLSIATRNPQFQWDQLAPPAEVDQKSGTYFIYTTAFWLRRQQGAERAPDADYTRVGYGVSTGTYNCIEYGFEKLLGDPIRAGSLTPEDLEEVDSQFLVNLIEIELEKLVSAAAFVTGVWGTSNTPPATSKWDQFDTSDPIANADTAIRTVRRATGIKPNTAFIGAEAWDYLKEHPLVTDKFKHTQVAILTPALVAPVMGVEELIVGETAEETGAEGGSSSTADIWTDNALFFNKVNPGLMVPAGALSFMWNEAGNVPWAVQNYREEKTRGQVTRVFTHADPQITSSGHGYIHLNVIT